MQLMILLNLSSTFVSYMSELAHTTLLQVIISQLLSKGKHVEKMHDSTSDAAVGGDHKVETLGLEKNACRAHKSRRQDQSSQKLHSVETGAVVTCIKV